MDYSIKEKIMVESKLNTSEKIAYDWLKSKYNYCFGDIKKSNKTPDFLCNDGKNFEVKALYVNTIMFSQNQIECLKDSDFIIVVDTNYKKVIECFKWKDREKNKFKIYVPKKELITLKIEVETLKKFKQAKRLREFNMDDDLTNSEFIELMLENEFKNYDNKVIRKVRE